MINCTAEQESNAQLVIADVSFRIIRIPFTGSVKLRSLLLKTGPADLTPLKVMLVGVSSCIL